MRWESYLYAPQPVKPFQSERRTKGNGTVDRDAFGSDRIDSKEWSRSENERPDEASPFERKFINELEEGRNAISLKSVLGEERLESEVSKSTAGTSGVTKKIFKVSTPP